MSERDRASFFHSRFWMRYRRHRLALLGKFTLLILIGIAVFTPLITTHDPLKVNMRDSKEPPNAVYVLGTDKAGQDSLRAQPPREQTQFGADQRFYSANSGLGAQGIIFVPAVVLNLFNISQTSAGVEP